MASRRILKKSVKSITNELMTDCLILDYLNPEVDSAKIDEILSQIYQLKMEYVSRISHTEPGNPKKYYRQFREDFSNEITNILADITALS
ncbi:MAG: hypothetical protein ACRC9P_08240 [Bacteroides sp.]